MKAVAWCLLLSVASITYQQDPSICTPATATSGMKLPSISSQFTTSVECNFLHQNKTYDAVEFYDYAANMASVQFTMNDGTLLNLIYSYKTDELIIISPSESAYGNKCEIKELSTSNFHNLFGIEKNAVDGTVHIGLPSRVLRFGQDIPEQYMGKAEIRGIKCNLWRSCLYLEHIKATIQIYWYFSDDSVWQMGIGKTAVPIRAKLWGKMTLGNDAPTEFMNQYDFTSFRQEITDSKAFKIPDGVYCKSQKSVMPNPRIPTHFKTRIETIVDSIKFVSYQHETFDFENNLVLFEYKPTIPPLGRAPIGTHPVQEIHDFNTGTAYIKDMVQGNCTAQSLSDRFFSVAPKSKTDIDPLGIRIKTSKELFSFEKGNFIYQGKQMIRSIMCNKWVGMRNDFPPNRPMATSTWEWFFMDETWSESVGDTYERKDPVMLRIAVNDKITIPPGIPFPFTYSVIFNFFEFNEHQPSIFDFNIGSCYNRLDERHLEVHFKGNFTTLVQPDVEGFKYAVMTTIIKTAGISPLRVKYIWPSDKDSKIRVHFALLDRTPINGTMVAKNPEVSIDDAVKMVANSVQSGNFMIIITRTTSTTILNTTSGLPNTFSLTAIRNSFQRRDTANISTRTVKITDPGVLAGLGIAMMLVGGLCGALIVFLIIRRQKNGQPTGGIKSSATQAVNKIIMTLKASNPAE